MNFSAVILAGGKSSRMGRDKGLLEAGGQSLLARQIQIVRAAGANEVFISGRSDNDYAHFDCPILLDRFPNSGPLGGIQAALAVAATPRLLVLAVDMPLVDVSVLRLLLKHCREGSGAVPRVNGAIEPLSGFYPKAAANLALELLEPHSLPSETSPHELFTKLPSAKHFAERCCEAGLATFVEFTEREAGSFSNWNSPADIDREEVFISVSAD